MNIILFDDDLSFREKFEQLASENGYKLALSTDDSNIIKRYLQQYSEPALFFIDIVINHDYKAGTNLADYILETNKNHIIVFISSYPKLIIYNTHSKMQAHNIILKSREYFKSEFLYTMKKIELELSGGNYFRYYTKYAGIGIIPFDDIYYFEKIKGKNTIIIHKKMGEVKISGTFIEVSEKLDDRFLRCHNSIIINKNKIQKILTKERKIILNNNKICFYSYSHKREVEQCTL